MTIETSRAGNEAQIRERIEGWAKALRAKDVDAVMSYYTRDVLSFDLAPRCYRREMRSDEAGKSGSRRSAARLATRFAT